MEGGRGYTWTAFEENAREHESLAGWFPHNRNPISPTTGRLCSEDMAIYGEEPALDSLSLVICKQCGRVVKSQALLKHKELYHGPEMMNVPALHPPNQPFTTVAQPSSALSTNNPSSSGARGEDSDVMGFTATNLPSTSAPVVGSGSSTTNRSTKEYNPNKHCGVWIEEERRHCVRSLTCKFHPLSERRKVQGRSQPFDKLLDEHRKRKKQKQLEKIEKLRAEAGVPSGNQWHSMSPLRSPTNPSYNRSPPLMMNTRSAALASPTATDLRSPFHSNSLDDSEAEEFPKPLAVCSFGSRSSLAGGSLMFSRRQDQLRSALATLSGRTADYTQTTLHRKHSYSSLLKQKREQRKYFNHRHHVRETSPVEQRPSTLPLPLHPQPTPSTPSQPHNVRSPLSTTMGAAPTSTTTTATVSTPHQTPHNVFSPVRFYNVANNLSATVSASLNGEIPDTRTELSNPEETANSTDTPFTPPPLPKQVTDKQSGKRSSKKTKRKKGSRRDRHRKASSSRSEVLQDKTPVENMVTSDDSVNMGEPTETSLNNSGTELPASSTQSVSTHVNNVATSEPITQASENGPVSTAAEAPPEQTVPRSEVGSQSVPLVKVKEEPVTNHEEELQQSYKKSTVLNGMVTPPSSLPQALHTFNSRNSPQTFVINPTGQHPSPGHPIMTSLSPHMTGMLPFRGMSPNQALFPSQTFQLAQSLQQSTGTAGGVSSPVHLASGLQMLPDQLQRHMIAQNALLQRQQLLLQQQQQQQQQASRSPISSGPPQLTSLRGNMPTLVQQNSSGGGLSSSPGTQNYNIGGMMRTGQSSSPTLSGKFQIAASSQPLNMYRTATGVSRVRAPISHIPSLSGPPPLHQDPNKKLTDEHRPQNTLSPQTHYQNPSSGTSRPHFPSQQVT